MAIPDLTLQALWAEYAHVRAIPPEHQPVFQRFFYAGALACLRSIVSTDDPLQKLEDLKSEIRTFLGLTDAEELPLQSRENSGDDATAAQACQEGGS